MDELETAPEQGAEFGELPPPAAQVKNYKAWSRDFQNWLYTTQTFDLFSSPGTGEHSRPGESELDFRLRMQQTARERRDQAVEQLRQKYAPKVRTLEDRIFRAQQALDKEKEQARNQQLSSVLSIGTSVLGAIFGGSRRSTASVLTGARGLGRIYKEGQDVNRAGESVERLNEQLQALNAELEQQIQQLHSEADPLKEPLEILLVKPKKTNITVRFLGLVWKPV